MTGEPFGWAHAMERQAITDHLRSRGLGDGLDFYFRVSRIQSRLHRDYHRRKPPIGVRRIVKAAPRPSFTVEELERIAERFEGSNDPLGQEIARKARELIS